MAGLGLLWRSVDTGQACVCVLQRNVVRDVQNQKVGSSGVFLKTPSPCDLASGWLRIEDWQSSPLSLKLVSVGCVEYRNKFDKTMPSLALQGMAEIH